MATFGASEYNYATPLGSFPSLVGYAPQIYSNLMLLNANQLGNTRVKGWNMGWWSQTPSDPTGNLPTNPRLIITDPRTITAMILYFDPDIFPSAFSCRYYDSAGSLIFDQMVSNNASSVAVVPLSNKTTFSRVELTFMQLNTPNNIVKVFGVDFVLSLTDFAYIEASSTTNLNDLSDLGKLGSIVLNADGTSIIRSLITEQDVARLNIVDTSVLSNIHSVMKEPSREILGKVEVSYVNPLRDDQITITVPSTSYNSSVSQITDGILEPSAKFFRVGDNTLDGSFKLMGNNVQTGWWTQLYSDDQGNISLTIPFEFTSRPITSFIIAFDPVRQVLATNFDIVFRLEDGTSTTFSVTNNTSYQYYYQEDPRPDVVGIDLVFKTLNKPNTYLTLLDVSLSSLIEYYGEDLMNISLIEELSYEDETETLGGVSANEITVTFNNDQGQFYFNNSASLAARQLKKNRRVRAWLGAYISEDILEWHPLGTYWTYRWDVPTDALHATCVGFDTIGFLATTEFIDHTVFINQSIGWLVEYVLNDARKFLEDIAFDIDQELYSIIIPYAWFEKGNHATALNKIARGYFMDIYCDRMGRIAAKLRKNAVTYFDTWSDSTNVTSKAYPTLYTTQPNIISVGVNAVSVINKQILNSTQPVPVQNGSVIDNTFSEPYVSEASINVDSSATYTSEIYSWGLRLRFTSAGTLNSISVTGNCLEMDTTASVVKENVDSIITDGVEARSITSEFIQTPTFAESVAERVMQSLASDLYEADVNYRGDIALTIADPIRLLDGIAPTDRYTIKRHTLYWDGGLTGTANLIASDTTTPRRLR